jgi:hypothetical protein
MSAPEGNLPRADCLHLTGTAYNAPAHRLLSRKAMAAVWSVSGYASIFLTALIAAGAAAQAQAPDSPVIPDTAKALQGEPSVRVEITPEGAVRQKLGAEEAARERLEVSIVNNRFYWTSRDNRLLSLKTAGEFVYLASLDPGHYIRFRQVNDRISYVEHVDTGFGSVTYWGELRIVLGK